MFKIFNSSDDLKKELDIQRKNKKKIILCHGVFDLLHIGHLRYFNSAKKKADFLVVTVTCDRYVNKGNGRPVFNHFLRAEMIAALEVVDAVYISNFPTSINVINLISKNITYFSIKKIQARITNNVTLKTLKTLDNFGLTKSNTLIIDDRSDVWDFEYRDIILQIDPYYAPHYVINYKSPVGITYNKFNWNSNYDEALLEFMKMIKCVNTQFNKFTIDTILHKLNKQKI
jgi:cytidyltransferase-like protein